MTTEATSDSSSPPAPAAALAAAGKVAVKESQSSSGSGSDRPIEEATSNNAPTNGNNEHDANDKGESSGVEAPAARPKEKEKRETNRRKNAKNKKSFDNNKNKHALPDYSTLLPKTQIAATVQAWIDDDMPSFDVGGLVVGTSPKTAQLWMKSTGIFAGKPFFDAVFDCVGCTVTWTKLAAEGKLIKASGSNRALLATVTGPCNSILRGERTALCALSRCSGVATESREAVDTARSYGWDGLVAGTRKTTPGFRIVEKYGLLVGGAATHRLDLSQMVMLKDNHVWSAGSIEGAVKLARRAAGFSQKIEVECRDLDEAIEAATAGADVVMLDNYEPDKLKEDAKTLKEKFPHVLIEASGGITAETMGEYLSEHVDVVSQGRLTQGYHCLDYSLKIKR